MAKSTKTRLKEQIASNKKWTKYYLEAMLKAVDSGEMDEAAQIAMQIAPMWGLLEQICEGEEW